MPFSSVRMTVETMPCLGSPQASASLYPVYTSDQSTRWIQAGVTSGSKAPSACPRSPLERLDGFDFARVVPSHGTPSPTLEPGDMRRRLRALVARLRRDLANE